MEKTNYHIEEYLKNLDKRYGKDEELHEDYLCRKKLELFSQISSIIRDCIIKQTEGFEQNYLYNYFDYLIHPTYEELKEKIRENSERFITYKLK